MKWLIGVNNDMEGETYWPLHNAEAGSLVRKEVNANETWPKYRVHIKRYHGIYFFIFPKIVSFLFLWLYIVLYNVLKIVRFDNILIV